MLARVQVHRKGRFHQEAGRTYHGPLRLRLLFGLPADSPRRLAFQYYFERFGEVQLFPTGEVPSG